MNTQSPFRLLQLLLFPLVLLLVALLAPAPAAADIDPNPEMTFDFVYETVEPLTIVGGQQWQCPTVTCADARLLTEAGPQGFRCTASGCVSVAYGYSEYNRLVIEFSDGITRESNVFETRTFNNRYRVTVRENDLLVERIGGNNPANRLLLGVIIVLGCLLLLGVGLLLGVAVLLRRRRAAAG